MERYDLLVSPRSSEPGSLVSDRAFERMFGAEGLTRMTRGAPAVRREPRGGPGSWVSGVQFLKGGLL